MISRIAIIAVVTASCLTSLATAIVVPCFTQSEPNHVAPLLKTQTEHSFTLTSGDPIGGGGTPIIISD